ALESVLFAPAALGADAQAAAVLLARDARHARQLRRLQRDRTRLAVALRELAGAVPRAVPRDALSPARLYPIQPGRSHGDGARRRGALSIPRLSPGAVRCAFAGAAQDVGAAREVPAEARGRRSGARRAAQAHQAALPRARRAEFLRTGYGPGTRRVRRARAVA